MERNSRGRRIRKKIFTGKMQANLLLVFCIVIASFAGLMIRIYYIDQNDGERYTKKVLSQQSYVSNAIEYRRGEIVDRNNTVLAKSQKVYNLVISPKDILSDEKYKTPVLTAAASSFDIKQEELEAMISEKPDSQYIVVKKGIDYDTKTAFEENTKDSGTIHGIWFEEEYKRVYPLHSTACRIVGFANPGNTADIGIESYYNDVLNGTNGREYGYYDQNLELQEIVKPAENGNTVVSTIDVNVQQIVEEKLEKFNQDMGAKNVGIVLMNPQNGEIYAMACNQQFDLNNPRELTGYFSNAKIEKMNEEQTAEALNKVWYNYCIGEQYEPGSTFKPMTVGAALEEGVATDNSTYVCDGGEKVEDRTINCMSSHGTITLGQTLEYSCNDALMQIGAKLGRKRFAKYQSIFCFGMRTGIDIPGEAAGTIYTEDGLNPVELATSSFGQGVTVTMVQLAAATSSVINGGYYYQPHLVKEIRNESGAVVETIDPVLVRQTVSNHTSDLIRKYMYDTVEKGTGTLAAIPGYAIGGKTGTAEKIPRGSGKHLVSFTGFAPADSDPELLVYVVVDEANAAEQDHSYYATNLCHDIMAEVMPFLDIYPSVPVEGEASAEEEPVEETEDLAEKNNTESATEDEKQTEETNSGKKKKESPSPTPFNPEDIGREGSIFESGEDEKIAGNSEDEELNNEGDVPVSGE